MIIGRVMNLGLYKTPAPTTTEPKISERFMGGRGRSNTTKAKQTVTPESSKGVATAYRAANILSDDIGMMPLQLFRKTGELKEQVAPDVRIRNVPYLLEVSPNRWGWTPFLFKKAIMQWLLFYGNSYVWSPPVWPFEMFILPADVTYPVYDIDGNLWYCTTFSNANGKPSYIPAVEVLQLLINPDNTGQVGRGVIEFARESIGRQQGAYDTESNLFAKGMNPAAYMQVAGDMSKDARHKVQQEYGDAIGGVSNAYGLAVMDAKIMKFEPISMKLVDAQFLQLIEATDRDIANFFGMPLHMLNMGKEAYASNEQRFNEYLSGTLNAHLVPFEQAARIRWLSEADQADCFFRFIRDSLLRMDGVTRASMNEVKIRSGQLSPNEAREKEDLSPYEGGDNFYMASNYAEIAATAALAAAAAGGKQ